MNFNFNVKIEEEVCVKIGYIKEKEKANIFDCVLTQWEYIMSAKMKMYSLLSRNASIAALKCFPVI